jgi:hypothetical protein
VTEIIVAPTSPFAVEVMVYEEDTWMLMSAGNTVREIRESSEVLERRAMEQQPRKPGELVKRGQRWYAIVHDLDRPDLAQDSMIDETLSAIFTNALAGHIRSMGIQALGNFNGSGSIATFVDKVRQEAPTEIEQIWIQTTE